jgi:predicted dehydrogenase
MESSDHTKVAILGAGRGGRALLDLLHQIPSIEIVGIADRDPAAPGLQRARELQVPVTTNMPDLISNHGVSLIMDVTGDPEMEAYLQQALAGRHISYQIKDIGPYRVYYGLSAVVTPAELKLGPYQDF